MGSWEGITVTVGLGWNFYGFWSRSENEEDTLAALTSQKSNERTGLVRAWEDITGIFANCWNMKKKITPSLAGLLLALQLVYHTSRRELFCTMVDTAFLLRQIRFS